MRIVLVTSLERGGPVEQALLLARGLAAEGDEVLVTCANEELAARFAVDGVRAEVAPMRHQLDVAGARRVWRLARGAEVVHAHDRRAGLWVRLGPRPSSAGIRVYTVHGIPEQYHPPPAGPERPGWKARLAYEYFDSALCRRVDQLVVPSRAVAEDLVRRLRFPRERITVVPNGIELPAEPSPPGELIGTMSVLEPYKGIDVWLRAAAELAERRPELRFAAFGSGSQRDDLGRLARELGLEGRLEWPGFVPTAEALGRLRVYVLSSYWENAPMALLEAMAAEVPVVASAVDGVPEIVDESVAQLFPAGDHGALAAAVERLLSDDSLREAQVRAARRRVEERFTARANAQAMRELYERLLASRSR